MLLYSICCHYSCEPQHQLLKLKNREWMNLQSVYFVTHCEALALREVEYHINPYFAIRVTVWYMAVKQPSSSLPQPSHQYQCNQKLPEVFVFNVKSYQDDHLRDFTTLRLYQLSYINISIVNIKISIQYQNINCLIINNLPHNLRVKSQNICTFCDKFNLACGEMFLSYVNKRSHHSK